MPDARNSTEYLRDDAPPQTPARRNRIQSGGCTRLLSAAGGPCRRGFGAHDLPKLGDWSGDVNLAVRVHTQVDLTPIGQIRDDRGGGALTEGNASSDSYVSAIAKCRRAPKTLQGHGPHETPTASCPTAQPISRRSRAGALRCGFVVSRLHAQPPGGATPYHSSITPGSPTGRTLPDQQVLTCYFMPALDWRRRPWTVSTTCAMWYPVRDPGSGPGRLLARQSGIAGCSVVSHSRPRPSHVSRTPL